MNLCEQFTKGDIYPTFDIPQIILLNNIAVFFGTKVPIAYVDVDRIILVNPKYKLPPEEVFFLRQNGVFFDYKNYALGILI